MMTFNRILYATDFSTTAATAFRYAARLAHKLDIPLDVLHVLPGIGPSRFEAVDLAADDTAVDVASRDAVAAFRRLSSAGIPDDVAVHYLVGRGQLPAPVILEEAGRTESSIIILGAHGQHAKETQSLGSVAAELMQRSTCPVLLVPTGVAEETVDEEFRSVLTFVSYSHLLKPVIQFALQLARLFEARLDVLVMTNSKSATETESVDSDLAGKLEGQLWRVLESQSDESGDTIPFDRIRLHVQSRSDVESVLKFAREHQSDLFIIEAPGLGRVESPTERMLERIVNQSPCPVVLVNTCGKSFGRRFTGRRTLRAAPRERGTKHGERPAR